MIIKVCLICHKEYLIKAYRENISKFCSRKCFHLSRKGIPTWQKGKPLTKEVKLKIGKKLMGRVSWNKGLRGSGFGEYPENRFNGEPWNKGKKVLAITAERNPQWKGERAGNKAIHCWIRRRKGKPTVCADCGALPENCKLDWSNINHKYSRNLNDYISRCRSCHRKYDYNLFGKPQKAQN